MLALDLPKHAHQVRLIGSDAGNQAHIERAIQVGPSRSSVAPTLPAQLCGWCFCWHCWGVCTVHGQSSQMHPLADLEWGCLLQDISAARDQLRPVLVDAQAGSTLSLENGQQLANELQAHGLALAALKASPYFTTFRLEMFSLQANLRVLADMVGCLMQVRCCAASHSWLPRALISAWAASCCYGSLLGSLSSAAAAGTFLNQVGWHVASWQAAPSSGLEG